MPLDGARLGCYPQPWPTYTCRNYRFLDNLPGWVCQLAGGSCSSVGEGIGRVRMTVGERRWDAKRWTLYCYNQACSRFYLNHNYRYNSSHSHSVYLQRRSVFLAPSGNYASLHWRRFLRDTTLAKGAISFTLLPFSLTRAHKCRLASLLILLARLARFKQTPHVACALDLGIISRIIMHLSVFRETSLAFEGN